jgi:hypothetical protein
MLRCSVFFKGLFFSWFLCLSISFAVAGDSDYLPGAKFGSDWQLVDSIIHYKGDDLFYLIDGGAAVFLEYGFNDVSEAEYKNHDGLKIRAEVYRMADAQAAYGIYSLKKSPADKPLLLGQEAVSGESYIFGWKGDVFLILSGDGDSAQLAKPLFDMAKSVFEKVQTEGKTPLLMGCYPTEGAINNSAVYFKGDIALSNIYSFGQNTVAGYREGITVDYKDHRLFIFDYADQNSGYEGYEKAKEAFRQSKRFTGFKEIPDGFRMIDRKGQRVVFQWSDKQIKVTVTSKKG